MELEIKLGETQDLNDEKETAIKKEIERYNDLLRVMTIKIQRLDEEFDGLFISREEVLLSNSMKDTLKIPPKSPIIIEIKNHSKFGEIVSDLRKKKKILESIGFKKDSFYFVGILRGLDINEKLIEEKNQIKKSFNFKNMIVIYPDKSKFLDVPLYDIKEGSKGIKSEPTLRAKLYASLINIINKKLEELKSDLKKELLDAKDNIYK